MKEKPSEIIDEVMTEISLSVYGTINIMRPMFDHVDKEGNVTIPADDFRSLLDLLVTKDTEPVDQEVLKESVYARLQYRKFLVNALNHSGLVPNKLVTFIAGDTVVGIIRGGKIMGSVFPKSTDDHQAFDGSIISKTEDGKIYLDPDKFMTGAGTHGVITPCGMYLYCKAGDGLISVWTHLMLNRGCKRYNRLTILDDDGRGLYEFRYELCDDETPGESMVHVDQYELHPRMRFNEYYLV